MEIPDFIINYYTFLIETYEVQNNNEEAFFNKAWISFTFLSAGVGALIVIFNGILKVIKKTNFKKIIPASLFFIFSPIIVLTFGTIGGGFGGFMGFIFFVMAGFALLVLMWILPLLLIGLTMAMVFFVVKRVRIHYALGDQNV